jgi:hypothetical protein
MKTKLITKIALGVAIAALLFSIVTFIRSLIIGANIFLGAILVVGTAIIVVICAVMLYYLNNYDAAEEDEADASPDPADDASDISETAETAESPDDVEAEVDSLIADLEADHPYNLHNFE